MSQRILVTRKGLFAYLVALVVIALDQLSKGWALHALQLSYGATAQNVAQACDYPPAPIPVLPFFHIHLVCNGGVSFGLLKANSDIGKWLLIGFAAAVVVLLVVWAARQARWLAAIAMGLIIGGAMGNNFIDRVRFGHVVDFLDFGPIFPWVFNVADSGISIGVVLLLIDSFLVRDERPKAPGQG
jgi:signal peptidase II